MKLLTLSVAIVLASCRPGLAYKAAVIEYYPEKGDTADETILKNLETYKQYADTAKDRSADIVVFPEYGLTTVVEDPESYAIAINDSLGFGEKVITQLKNIAKERELYLVVNLLEKEENVSSTSYYNTDLVFDKSGRIVLKYRKINLEKERKLTPGSYNQNLTFTTDFGTTFGIFTGLDILYNNPSRTVLANPQVTDIVYLSAWTSTLPFRHSLSLQHGYALSNGVNLLASNYGRPREGRGGSGIYTKDSVREEYIADSASSKPIVQEVSTFNLRSPPKNCPKILGMAGRGLPGDVKSNVSNFLTSVEFNSSAYKIQNAHLRQEGVKTVCDGAFCCDFDIEVEGSQDLFDVYKLVAFDGFQNEQTHVRICALVACGSEDSSCGQRVNVSTSFKKITVNGSLPKDDTSFYSPITLNTHLLTLRQISYCDENAGNNNVGNTFVQLSTTQGVKDLLVFGIIGGSDNAPFSGEDEETGGNFAFRTMQASFYTILTAIVVKYVVG